MAGIRKPVPAAWFMDDILRSRADLRLGSLEVRLAESEAELEAAQRLRFDVFYDEMKAVPTGDMQAERRDYDPFDGVADHLLVIDHGDHHPEAGAGKVVGTYRLIRRSMAEKVGKFYTADEYVIDRLLTLPGEIMELGRSCVAAEYRTRPTMQLLWRGIAAYVFTHDIALMFGCASLHGTDPEAIAAQLSYLYHYHLAPPAFRPVAVPSRYVDMRILPPDKFDSKRVAAELPPLIKGYLRLGGYIGDGAVVDHQFNTTDVCVVVKTDLIAEKYARHYNKRLTGDAEGTGMGASGGLEDTID